MQTIHCSEVIKATGGKLLCGDADTSFAAISTDSRKISQGDLFVPIAGENFNGHDFIRQSLEAGAAGALTHQDTAPVEGRALIQVADTQKALQDIAAFYRSKFPVPAVGVTGSVGKTSTKDMIASVLKESFQVLKTQGNFNNEIGLPLTVFQLDPGHEAVVLEMGMSGFGEISRLTYIVKPDIAVITNIGVSHIEKLGSRQNILKAKLEILEGLRENGLLVLNGDDKLLYGVKDLVKCRTVFFGMEEGMDYQAFNVKSAGEKGTYFEISIKNQDYKVHVPAPGVHHVYNALAAIAVGMEMKIPMEKIIRGIGDFSTGKMRMNIVEHGNIKIINDTYNASPQSMEAALDVLKEISSRNRSVAILGDMLEMGEYAGKMHQDVGKYAARKGIDYLLTVGSLGEMIAEGAKNEGMDSRYVFSCKDNGAMNTFLKDFIASGDRILVKGSRGMKMEEIVQFLEAFDI